MLEGRLNAGQGFGEADALEVRIRANLAVHVHQLYRDPEVPRLHE